MSDTGNIKSKKQFTVFDMAVVGVMAAIIFALTYFIKVEIPTPAGPVMLKIANAFCLLAGILFGGLKGGLAAGFGSMLFDLFDPKYMADAPFTFVRFFLMAFICGAIVCSKWQQQRLAFKYIIGSTAGSLFSVLFYFVQSVVKQIILGQPFDVAILNILPKMSTSLINAVIAVVIACLIAPMLKAALKKAGFYQKIKV